MKIGSWEIRLLFAWYDLWVGAFYDKKNRRLYVCLLPMLGFVIQFGAKEMFSGSELD